ncbi:MAG: substrate-binding domain-containing protein [Terriglobales bacterium]
MTKLNVLVSLTTKDNDFQREQAAAAEVAARNLDTNIQIVYAGNSAIEQSHQLLTSIQGSAERPDAILVEPVGTAMPQVAAAAAAAGIGWGMLNREAEYAATLRGKWKVPIFVVTTDQEEAGRLQGKQFAALLKEGGSILYIEGPSTGEVARQRTSGMQSTKPGNVTPRILRGDWTEASGYRAVKSWLALGTSQQMAIRLIGSQNDVMAMGARKAFEEVPEILVRKGWLGLPFTGVDGVPETGQEWVRRGVLAATVITPPTTGLALEMMVKAIRSGVQPPEQTVVKPSSYPALEELTDKWSK